MTESDFQRRKSMATSWRNKANDLLGAAGLVWLGMQSNREENLEKLGLPDWYSFKVACPSVYRMLCGMATELLLKAIIVQRGQAPIATHDLNRLAQQASVPLDQNTSVLLKILSESVQWDGRYPVPKTERHFVELHALHREALIEKVPLGSFHVLRPNGALDWDGFIHVWTQFNDVYICQEVEQ